MSVTRENLIQKHLNIAERTEAMLEKISKKLDMENVDPQVLLEKYEALTKLQMNMLDSARKVFLQFDNLGGQDGGHNPES